MEYGALWRNLSFGNIRNKQPPRFTALHVQGAYVRRVYYFCGVCGRVSFEFMAGAWYMGLLKAPVQHFGTDFIAFLLRVVLFKLFDMRYHHIFGENMEKQKDLVTATQKGCLSLKTAFFQKSCFSISVTTRSATCSIQSATTVQPAARTCPPPPK